MPAYSVSELVKMTDIEGLQAMIDSGEYHSVAFVRNRPAEEVNLSPAFKSAGSSSFSVAVRPLSSGEQNGFELAVRDYDGSMIALGFQKNGIRTYELIEISQAPDLDHMKSRRVKEGTVITFEQGKWNKKSDSQPYSEESQRRIVERVLCMIKVARDITRTDMVLALAENNVRNGHRWAAPSYRAA